jgi:hypothetical protein
MPVKTLVVLLLVLLSGCRHKPAVRHIAPGQVPQAMEVGAR